MQEDIHLIISSLQSKIEKLIHLHKKSVDENLKLNAAVEALQQQATEQLEQINNLKNENKSLLQNTKSLELQSKKDSVKLNKQELKEIVQDIDRCIEWLGNK